MAKKSMILKQQRTPKFSTRGFNRCKLCGRPHAYLRESAGYAGDAEGSGSGGCGAAGADH